MPPRLKLPTINDTTKKNRFVRDIEKCNDPKLYSHDSNVDRLKLDNWVLPNRKDFMKFLKNTFNLQTIQNSRNSIRVWKDSENKFIDISPFRHQKYVSDYLSDYSPYRGLLLYHGLGSGKSGASVMIGEGFHNKHVVILLPASLRDNYINEINKFAEIAYRNNYHWCKITFEEGNAGLEKFYTEEFEKKGLDKTLIDKIKVTKKDKARTYRTLWMIDYTKEAPNYSLLSEKDKEEIDNQIRIMIDHKYSILHYNAGQYTITKILERLVPDYKIIYSKLFGEMSVSKMTNKHRDMLLNYIYDPSNNVENPFNNKVLIVDEIHNLTSKMVGSGYNGSRLYELIIRAQNLKVVFLSGTPVINNPYELALMFNMLRGFIYQYRIPLQKKEGNFNAEELNRAFHNIDSIDRINVDIASKSVDVTRLPLNFVNKYDKSGKKTGVQFSTENGGDEKEFIQSIFKNLVEHGYQQAESVERTMLTVFPGPLQNSQIVGSMRGSDKYIELAEKNFNDVYVDKTSLKVNNSIEFKNRILGLVSFYNEISGLDAETGANLFPDKIYASPSEVTVNMSNYQFIEYGAKRRIERKLEDASKRQQGREDINVDATQKMPSLFKVFSRQKGVFVFPPSIKRPVPPKNNKFLKKQITKSEYYNLSEEAMNDLIERVRNILLNDDSEERIKEYSEFLDGFEVTSSEYRFIEKLIAEIMSNYSNVDDYMDWISTHDFEEDTFEISDVVEEAEEDYRTQCINAINKLTSEHLTVDSEGINLEMLSPKYAMMLKNINNSPGNVFCYSQFRSVEGIEIFSKALTVNGYTKLHVEGMGVVPHDYDTLEEGHMVRYMVSPDEYRSFKIVEIDGDEVILEDSPLIRVPKTSVHKCRFALWTGTETVDIRRGIQNTYNSSENMYGQECMVLLTTQSGSEGISLMNVRQVHVMEPYWNNVRIDQVIGRARRIKSHIYLPERHRNVKIFQYIIKFTEKQVNGTWIRDMSKNEIIEMRDGEDNGFVSEDFESEETDDDEDNINGFKKYAQLLSDEIREQDKATTSDEVLDRIAKNKEEILSEFLKCIKETSVDCEFNWDDNVRSDSKLNDLTCYNNIYNEGDYSFDLVTNDSKVSQKKETHEKVVKTRYLNISTMVNKTKLKIMISIPSELNSISNVSEIFDKLPSGYDGIYDYYLYNNLYFKDISQRNPLVKIAKLDKSKGKMSFTFDSQFLGRVHSYSIVELCISRKGTMPSDQVKRIHWANSIRECHKELTETGWTCPVCDTLYEAKTSKCEKCSITKEDLLSFQVNTSVVEKESTSDSSSIKTQSTVKSKGSTRRVRF